MLLDSGHKVAVGDIVKVTNGQHIPADMVIVSSRSDITVLLCLIILASFGFMFRKMCYFFKNKMRK